MKISVVLASKEDVRILGAIDSIKAQNYPPEHVEIVIHDALSSDAFVSKVRAHLPQGSRLISEADTGIFDGINRGLEKAKGEIILTLGSDDRIYDLDLFLKVKEKYEAGANFIFCGLSYTDENWNELRRWPAYRFTWFNYLIGRQFAHLALFCTKDVYRRCKPFNIKNPINADYEFFLDMLRDKKKLGLIDDYIDEYAIQMRMGGTSSKSVPIMVHHNFRILAYLAKNEPILLPGQLLKPVHKLIEAMRVRFSR